MVAFYAHVKNILKYAVPVHLDVYRILKLYQDTDTKPSTEIVNLGIHNYVL